MNRTHYVYYTGITKYRKVTSQILVSLGIIVYVSKKKHCWKAKLLYCYEVVQMLSF